MIYLRTRAKQAAVTLLVLCGCVLALGAQEEDVKNIYLSPQGGVQRGEILSVFVEHDAGLRDVAVELVDAEEQVVADTEGFRLRLQDKSEHWAALLGVPNTIGAGDYTVTATLRYNNRQIQQHTVVAVGHKDFASETIPLRAQLTTLRTTRQDERIAEAIVINELYNTVNRKSIYDGQALDVPVTSEAITSMYADRRTYAYSDGTSGHAIHRGVDYGLPRGSIVAAAAGGRVAFAKERIITGNTVVLEHLPGVYTVYAHLDQMFVKKGRAVERGETIGTVGSTGLSTAAHLHWELRVGGEAVDPLSYLQHAVLDTSVLIDDNSN